MAEVDAVLRIDIILLVLVAITAIAVIEVRSLFSATMLAGIYSLLMAIVWSNMHALDVAFTEAAVGAGISTVLLLGALVKTGRWSKPSKNKVDLPALIIVLITGAMLVYGTSNMPQFGDPAAPIHNLRVPEIHAPAPGATIRAHDVESGAVRTVRLDDRAAARIAERARAHADLWAHHAHSVGMLYMPFAPSGSPEALLRRLILEVP